MNIVSSAINSTNVPFCSSVFSTAKSSTNSPLSKEAPFFSPSRTEYTLKLEERAFTAFVPTPFNPTDFLNAFESYLPPVFILETTSTTFPKGIPRP